MAVLHTPYLRADGISHSYGDRRVLTNVSLTISPGQRVGLIGENGAGKSTLLRFLAGAEQPDQGEISRPASTGMLWQEVPFGPEDRLVDVIDAALADVRAIERELTDAATVLATDSSDPASRRYDDALAAAERAEVWSVDARRDAILAGLGVGQISLTRRLDEVSGGQRSRFALAALLLRRPDALLLDEPTNHLDDEAAAFLEREVLGWQGPVLFASHDRAFLDAVATNLIDLDPARGAVGKGGTSSAGAHAGNAVTMFGAARADATARAASSGSSAPAVSSGSSSSTPERVGAYTAYLTQKHAERARWEQQYADEQAELKALKFSADVTARNISYSGPPRDNDKFAAAFKRGTLDRQIRRRVKNAQGRFEELRANQVRKPPALLSFAGIPSGSHALDDEAGTLIQVRDAVIPGRLRVERFRVEPGSRTLITGANGAGKSTLLAAMAGTMPVAGGDVSRRRGLRVGLLEQDVRFPDPAESPRAIYERMLGAGRAERVTLTSLGLIAPRDADRPVGALSVGQQRRLALALIIARPPHVFLLDEPTNHLSLTLATELEEALGSYPGAVVVASHDRWLRREWEGEQFALTAA
jgi:macrolide transport system ATP-binding/permease protein